MTETLPDIGAKEHKATPTGVVVTTAEPGTPEWFEARRGGITGTDLPKILGDTKYGNALSVWLDKRGDMPDEGVGEAGAWGTILEDPVAREWARRNNMKVRRVGVIRNTKEPWMRASLDRMNHHCPTGERCGLEVKTRSAFKRGSFREDIPDDVLAQVAWGRAVSGLHHMHVAVLIGGQELLSFIYERDEALEEFLVKSARPVWEAVTTGTPPDVEPDGDGVLLGILNKMYERRAGDRDVDVAKATELLADYDRGSDIEKEAKAVKEKAKTGLIVLLDDGDTGLVDGAPAFTYKRPNPSTGMPAKAVDRLRTEQPNTYAQLLDDGYLVTSQGGPRFNKK